MNQKNKKIDEEDLRQINLLNTEMQRRKTLSSLNTAWQSFINTGKLSDNVRPKIAASWQKSRLHHIDPNYCHYQSVDPVTLKQLLKENDELIKIASNIMQGLLSYNNQGHINLTTVAGVTLYSCGLDITPIGSILTETLQGTNCTGRCIIEEKLVYVLSAENYITMLRERNMDCAAAPIRDINDQIIGIITLTMGANEFFHYHTLGAVQAAADAISKQIQLQIALEKEKTFIESLDEGIIVIDNTGTIQAINNYARELFCLSHQLNITNINLSTISYLSTEEIAMLSSGIKYLDQEMVIKLKNQTNLSCMISVTPVKFKHFILSIREKKRVHKLTQKLMGAQARYTFDSIIGHSLQMQHAITIAKLSSQSDSTILILGESGTGKEMFAQAIHNASHRKEGPFIAVNCGALPRELVQSELFGYVDGAFTGAKRGGVPGKFELANGGTIFLDEIGDMPIEAQINLLRVIQENEVTRIGDCHPQKIDVRIIAATNKDLLQAIHNGAFRQDLYYRLNVISINVPSLKERIEDIPVLIDYFQTRICLSLNKSTVTFSKEVIEIFNRYPWPGNVRELENIVERSIHFTQNSIITPSDIPSEVCMPDTGDLSSPTNNRLQYQEKKQIMECLQETRGNLRKSALKLGLSRGSLYNKLNRYNINPNDYRI